MQGGVQTSSRLVGGPSGEWLSPVAAALVNDSQSADMWLEGPPNSPVGLGSQAVCVPFISVTCEIPRSPSGWSEAETARVWLEVHFPALRVLGGPGPFFLSFLMVCVCVCAHAMIIFSSLGSCEAWVK